MNIFFQKREYFNSLILICLFGFILLGVVYRFEDESLSRKIVVDQDKQNSSQRIQEDAKIDLIKEENKEIADNYIDHGVKFSKEVNQTKIIKKWIAMGLCWGENTEYHNKKNFPYSEAAIRSTSLWHRLTDARVIIQIFYLEEPTKELFDYKSILEKEGAIVYLNKTEPNIGCVLSAQISRLMTSHLEIIEENDVIITADTDAFIMTDKILQPLTLAGKKLWIWRYDLALMNGETFSMSFTAAYRNIWRNMIWFSGNLTEMYEHYKKIINYKDKYTWDVDQHILTHGVLSGGICSLPADNSLWKAVSLDPKSSKSRDKECWKGMGIWHDCNSALWYRNTMIRYYGSGCKWWHFLPSEGVKQLDIKYREILESPGDRGFVSRMIQSVASLRKNIQDQKSSSVKLYN